MTGKIYTKKGDGGQTKTMRGAMSKGDQLAVALGTIDELNSWLGLCRSQLLMTKSQILSSNQITNTNNQFKRIESEFKRMQNNLLVIGSGLAGSGKRLSVGETKRLERLIDKLTSELPELKNFIVPLGYLHVARAVARRAEREVVRAMTNDQDPNSNENPNYKKQVPKETLKYLNRLSDALFTMARWVNKQHGIQEEVWK